MESEEGKISTGSVSDRGRINKMGVQRQCICGINDCGMAGVWVWKGVGEWLHAQDYVRRAGSRCMSS